MTRTPYPLGKPIGEKPTELPEWSRILHRPGWWLHRDGVRKTYAPDGSMPNPMHKPETPDPELADNSSPD